MRDLVARHLLWLSIFGSSAAFLLARANGSSTEVAVLLASVAVLAVGAVMERVLPYQREWNLASGDARTDLASAFVLVGVVDPLLKAALPLALVAAWREVGPASSLPRVGDDFGFFLQVLAALLWIELARYGSHRWHHANRALWWLHALHHGSRRLYTLNNFRFHPVNHAINHLLSIGPLLILGVPADVLLACLAITQPVLMLQHANIDLRSGWLNRVFSSNEVHRWHHSNLAVEANCNFGSALLLWDHLFGTYRAASAGVGPDAIGLFGDGNRYPAAQGYVRQLGSMFSPACCRSGR